MWFLIKKLFLVLLYFVFLFRKYPRNERLCVLNNWLSCKLYGQNKEIEGRWNNVTEKCILSCIPVSVRDGYNMSDNAIWMDDILFYKLVNTRMLFRSDSRNSDFSMFIPSLPNTHIPDLNDFNIDCETCFVEDNRDGTLPNNNDIIWVRRFRSSLRLHD